MIDHFNAYAIPVSDLEKCIEFYRDKVGLKLKGKEDDMAYFVFDNQDRPGVALIKMESVVNLISESQVRPREDTVHRTYFAVFLDDVDKEYEELKSRGVHFVKPPVTHPWGQRIAYFEDPEGNLWEISTFFKK
ncbi:MAG: VOC family protein [Nitrososphaerota archaeon]|nr:VOC family protein [Nitrososphaerota archaeon]